MNVDDHDKIQVNVDNRINFIQHTFKYQPQVFVKMRDVRISIAG